MGTIIGTVASPQEAETVVQRLLAAGFRPSHISVLGAQGTPLSLPPEQKQAARGALRGMSLFGLLGAIVGVLLGLLALHVLGLGLGVHGHTMAGPAAALLTAVLAGLAFGGMAGFLAYSVTGEEQTAP